MSTYLVLYLLTVHWIADFVLQADEMALKKSKSFGWLGFHVLVYVGAFALMTAPLVQYGKLQQHGYFLAVNGVLHFATDAVTSRLSAWIYPRSRHYFFVMIGFDQLLHYAALLLTYQWLLGAN